MSKPGNARNLLAKLQGVSIAAIIAGSPAGIAPALAQSDANAASQAAAEIPTPTVSGPVTGEDFNSPTNNYTFFDSDIALESHGYVEEEFFVEGVAKAYDAPARSPETPPTTLASVVEADIPYRTRMVVRRPADPAQFNGTIVVEWFNVSDGFDGEYFWVQSHDFLVREGYAYIGISAQDNSISDPETGLIAFSSERYGDLDVAGSGDDCCAESQLSFDIFNQAAKAALEVPAVLDGLEPDNVIGVGMSQSGRYLGVYANYIHGLAPIYDGLLIQVSNPAVRDDLGIPLIKVLSESEADEGGLEQSQPDTDTRKTYWVAGTTHGDITQRNGRNGVRLRDLGLALTSNDDCGPTGPMGESTTRTRTPLSHVLNAAVHHLKAQIENGTQPPSGAEFEPDADDVVARDDMGNVIGGIRLAASEAPIARADGLECGNIGVWEPFTTEELQELYPSHEAYVQQVRDAVDANVEAGFVLPDDAAETIAAAETSVIGTGLECGPLCLDRGHYKTNFSSTGILRGVTEYYNIVDGEELIAAVDAAHRYVAEGDSATGLGGEAMAQQHYALAQSQLRSYLDLLEIAEAEGRVTATAAEVLSMQAHAIIDGLSG